MAAGDRSAGTRTRVRTARDAVVPGVVGTGSLSLGGTQVLATNPEEPPMSRVRTCLIVVFSLALGACIGDGMPELQQQRSNEGPDVRGEEQPGTFATNDGSGPGPVVAGGV